MNARPLAATAFLACLAGLAPASAQDGQDARSYFDQGASSYVRSQTEDALSAVQQGLAAFPDDARLRALKELIERQQQQDQQQRQQDQQPQGGEEDKKEKQDEKEGDSAGDRKDGQQPAPRDESGDSEQQKKPSPERAEDMTPEEARLLLDALRQQEQADRDRVRLIMGQPASVEKDW